MTDSTLRLLCRGLLEGSLSPAAFLLAVRPDPLRLDAIVLTPPLEWTAQHVLDYLGRFGAGEVDEEELGQWATLLVGMDQAFRCRGAPEDLVAWEALFQIGLQAATATLTAESVAYWYQRIQDGVGSSSTLPPA
ncbi:MAG: hypothetical protein NZ951_04240 [Dehalococcoidia bacterium]|nr:hypothetical protein [Dehalococcoidia bacterium]MDW8119646.1 hypothetical protein [Chloroflexota bacterium]